MKKEKDNNELDKEGIRDLLKQNSIYIKALLEKLEEKENELRTWDRISDSDIYERMDQVAKTLDYEKFGQNKLYAYLREKNILRWNNQPYQEYINRDYFKVIQQPYINKKTGDTHIHFRTLVSPKGIDYIRKLIDKENMNDGITD